MRYALIIGRRENDNGLSVVVPPANPQAINAAYKDIIREPSGLVEIHLIESSSGIVRQNKFRPALSATATGKPSDPDPSGSDAPPEAGESDDDGPTLLPAEKSKKSKP